MTNLREAYARALRDESLRRIALAYIAFNVAEWATWVAILVYAYGHGGTAASSFVAVAQLIPAALFAPAGAAFADRTSRARMLLLAYLTQAVAMLATATAVAGEAPNVVIYLLAAVTATTITLTRPAQNGLLPSLAPDPDALTSANALLSAIENASIVIGPAFAGIVLAVSGAGAVFAIMAAALGAGALLVMPIRSPERTREAKAAPPDTSLRPLTQNRAVVIVIGLLAIQQLQIGALDVLFVALGMGPLDIGETGVGLLTSAVGVGGVLGAIGASAFIARRSLPTWIAAGSVAWGLGLALIAPVSPLVLAFALIVAGGAGRGLMDVAGRTMLQRIAPAESLSLAFGALESLTMGALAIGAAIAPALVDRYGARGAVAVAGIVLPIATAVALRWLLRARAPAPPDRVLRLLRGVPLFAPLPEPTLERIANALVPLQIPAGTTVVREGDAGDRVYVIETGRADVLEHGRKVRALGPGEAFGEIALLRDVPRTATVIATETLRLYALDRAPFLEAAQSRTVSAHALDAVSREA